MDLHNSLCLDLGGCVGSSGSAAKIVKKQEILAVPDSGILSVPSVKFPFFPPDISHLVGEYLPINERSHVETAFANVQPITLCLSQDIGSKLASCWSIGFLSPDHLWKPSDVKIDKEYQIQDYEGCLELLRRKNSNDCQLAIEVLVVKLSNTSKDLPSALYDLRITIKELKNHLGSVKHVVISIKEYVSCCFTLNDAVGKADDIAQAVDYSKTIFEILDDLYVCWRNPRKFTVDRLFDFYFDIKAKPASEKYLAKYVIPLNTKLNRVLFENNAPYKLSTKIMWVCYLKSSDDFGHFIKNTTRLCHAIDFDMSGKAEDDESDELDDDVPDVLFFQHNPFIERIVIDCGGRGCHMKLPRPSASLIDATPFSALIELTLKGTYSIFDLTQLNNGYFPHLAHLSIVGGNMTGRLDSQRVPSLKTLKIELGSSFHQFKYRVDDRLCALIREHTQAIVDTRRPWQLIASQEPNNWSLASYDILITNPPDEVKEDAPPSPPSLSFIMELMLVMCSQDYADECQSLLDGNPPLEAAAEDQNLPLLAWAPNCVEKITVFCISMNDPRLQFKVVIPGKTRILTSLACYDVNFVLDGAAVPFLQSLKLNRGKVTLSGSFPFLQTLSFEAAHMKSIWQVNAPLLKSLNCQSLKDGNNFILSPKLLPHLSYLRIDRRRDDPTSYPEIPVDEDSLEWLQKMYIVIGEDIGSFPFFQQWQVHKVSCLKLRVDAKKLPAYWETIEWQCETLTMNFFKNKPILWPSKEYIPVKMPPLPKVKKLTVTGYDCRVLLNSEMPQLTECTVPSLKSLGPNLKCPNLTSIRFAAKLSERDKQECLNPATYVAFGAQPKWVCFEEDDDAN